MKPDFAREEPKGRAQASLFDLINAVNAVLKRLTHREDLRDIFEDKWTVSEKIETILKKIALGSVLKFSALFAEATSRSEVVVTFLALLELMRLKQVIALQTAPFGEIEITKAPPGETSATTLAEAYAEAVTQEVAISVAHAVSGPPSDGAPTN